MPTRLTIEIHDNYIKLFSILSSVEAYTPPPPFSLR